MTRLLFLLLILPGLLSAQGVIPPAKMSDQIASFEAGVICAPEAVGERLAPDTVAGVTHTIAGEPPFVSLSRRVPAVLGVGFGVKAMVTDIEGLNDVTMVILHPPMGPDGQARQSFQTRISGLDPSLTFYQFDYDYELLPGRWQMEAHHAGEVIYRVSFDILPPQDVPELAAACGFEALLS